MHEMARFPADRRLYLSADRERVVEEGDPDARFLLCAEGRILEHGDIEAYGLSQADDGTVVAPGSGPEAKAMEKPEDKMADAPEDKAASDDLPDDFPGIGPLREAGVETYADLEALDDLTDVNGIGPATAKDIRVVLGG